MANRMHDTQSPRQVVDLDFGWRFFPGDDDRAAGGEFDDPAWRAVDIPHDWSIEGPFHPGNPAGGSCAWAPGGIAWYRKSFFVPADFAHRSARVEFDGVYHQARIFLNGQSLGRHDYGYSSFAFELEGKLEYGALNCFAVRVDNSNVPNCRWYSGSGIYRPVRLVFYDPLHVDLWGVFVTASGVSARSAKARVRARVKNDSREAVCFDMAYAVTCRSGGGAPGLGARKLIRGVALEPQSAGEFETTILLKRPVLWSPEDPALYSLETSIIRGGRTVDEYETTFGVRRAEFRPGRGFFLNGKETKLKGVCLHHDGGAVGAAAPAAVWKRRLGLLKEIGCNAIRCSHNPPDPQFLDLCDRMGFLVIDEAFDKWEGSFSTENEWWMRQVSFSRNWEADLLSMMRRDANHPSIILWSVGNETGQPGTDQIESWLEKLRDYARRIDPSRPLSAAFVQSTETDVDVKVERVMHSAALVDVLCVNYQEALYTRYHAVDPAKVIVGSETFPHWRGIPSSVHAFGLKNPWYDVVEHPYVAGLFVWPGIDYLGEAVQWPQMGWPHGIIDTMGLLKPGGQFHRSVWSGRPMVSLAVRDHGFGRGETGSSWAGYELSRRWNWPDCENRLVEVEAQTNCETVELFLNGTSYGEKEAAGFVNSAVIFLVPYSAGKLLAVARNGGAEAARDELETTGMVHSIRLSPDRREIAADGRDVAHILIALTDEQERVCPLGAPLLAVEVKGPARLLGLDNGSLDATESYTSGRRAAREGHCLALVQSTREAGEVEIEARIEASEAPRSVALRASVKIATRALEGAGRLSW